MGGHLKRCNITRSVIFLGTLFVQLGEMIRDTRKKFGVTQQDLALTSGTGIPFIARSEKGKETCELPSRS